MRFWHTALVIVIRVTDFVPYAYPAKMQAFRYTRRAGRRREKRGVGWRSYLRMGLMR